MTTAITLQDITIYPVVEQQGPFFDVMEFFPTLTKELPAILGEVNAVRYYCDRMRKASR